MLYKNGEKYALTAEDKKELMNFVRKFSVAVSFVPERISEIKDGKGRPKKMLPNGTNIDLKETVFDEKNQVSNEWIFANSVSGTKEKRVYTPSSYFFNGMNVFSERDIEFVWFLYNCCPVIRNGKNAFKHGLHELVFNLPFVGQEGAVNYQKKLNKVNAIIFGDEKEVSDDALRSIAKALFIPDIDKLTRIDIQYQLGEVVKTGNQKYDKNKILDEILNLQANPEDQKLKEMVQSGFEKGFLIFDENTRQVLLKVDDNTEKVGKKVPADKDVKDWAFNAIIGNQKLTDFLELAIS